MPIAPLITGQQVREAYAKASDVQKNVFDAESTSALLLQLSRQHAAYAGDLGKEVAYLILDLTTLTQFRSRLMQIQSDEKAVSAIVDIITKQVLMPMKNPASKKPAEPVIPPVQVVPPKPAPQKITVEIPAPTLKKREPFNPVAQKKVVLEQPPKTPAPPSLVSTLVTPSKPVVQPPVAPVKQPLLVRLPPKPSVVVPSKPPVTVTPAAKSPLTTPVARPRIVIGPHQMRTMEHDAASAKGHPGVVIRPQKTEGERPPVWDGAPARPVQSSEPTTPKTEGLGDALKKAGVDPYREPLG